MQPTTDRPVAIITGGAAGIGAAICTRLHNDGYTTVVFDVAPGAGSPGDESITVDITDNAQVVAAVAHVEATYGRLDVVINNAGIGAQGTVEDNDDAEWERVFGVNLFGMVKVSRAALPLLKHSSRAAIVNTCSIAATVGLPDRALYSATKGAVLSLTRAMATDYLPDGIRVNCVNPGTADTPWIGRLLSAAADPVAERAALEARQPHKRLVSPAEIAAAVAYLVDPDNRSTTGIFMAIDGGMQYLHPRS